MISKKNLLQHPNYLLSKYQIEIFRHLENYRREHNLTQKALAKKLGVSGSYVNQILKGKFNFTLKKLIELGIAIGKIPSIEFSSIDDYWAKQELKKQNSVIATVDSECQVLIKVRQFTYAQNISASGVYANEDMEYQDVWVSQSLN